MGAFAGWLAAQGVQQGDAVGLLAPNGAGFAIAFHGILRAGATASTINLLYTADEVANQLRDASAVALVTVSPLLPNALPAAAALGLPADRLVVLDGDPGTRAWPTCWALGTPRTSWCSTPLITWPCCRTARAPPVTPRA